MASDTGNDWWARLGVATPADRVTRLLALVEGHPLGRLELPSPGGGRAVLDGIDLSRDSLGNPTDARPWWNAARRGAALKGAALAGASLRRANLSDADLEEADLAGADLAGATLQRADFGGAALRGTLFEDADLTGASLRFATAREAVFENAKMAGADLWGADLAAAEFRGANLSGAVMEEANASAADLTDADLRGADLKRAAFGRAKLVGADLRGADLRGADLAGAVLRGAKLADLDLTGCTLTHAHLSGALLERTRFHQEQLGDAVGEELAGDYAAARKAYLALESNFKAQGDPDAESWAYRRRRRMEKRDAWVKARAAWAGRRYGTAARLANKYLADVSVEWLCDYGESVPRVLAALLTLYLSFAVLYGLTGSVVRIDPGGTRTVTARPADMAIFSLMAMTTSGTPSVGLEPRNAAVYLLTGIQAMAGIALTGLLGFVAGNRIRR